MEQHISLHNNTNTAIVQHVLLNGASVLHISLNTAIVQDVLLNGTSVQHVFLNGATHLVQYSQCATRLP